MTWCQILALLKWDRVVLNTFATYLNNFFFSFEDWVQYTYPTVLWWELRISGALLWHMLESPPHWLSSFLKSGWFLAENGFLHFLVSIAKGLTMIKVIIFPNIPQVCTSECPAEFVLWRPCHNLRIPLSKVLLCVYKTTFLVGDRVYN